MSNLKPCPFCGSSNVFELLDPNPSGPAQAHHVVCDACGARAAHHASREAAVAAWNRRAEGNRRPSLHELADSAMRGMLANPERGDLDHDDIATAAYEQARVMRAEGDEQESGE